MRYLTLLALLPLLTTGACFDTEHIFYGDALGQGPVPEMGLDAAPDLPSKDVDTSDRSSTDVPLGGADMAPDAGADGASPDGPAAPVPGSWVKIPAGTFQMGSPASELCRESRRETLHQVRLTRSFEIQNTEVTQGEFQARMGYNPSHHASTGLGYPCGLGCPVENLSWHQAAAYCNSLSDEGQPALPKCYTCTGTGIYIQCELTSAYADSAVYSCPGYRLPTEAEWEYAYRAGTETAFYNGDISACTGVDPNLHMIAWYSYSLTMFPFPVAQKLPNAWGLYDMAGNVAEWVNDWYDGGDYEGVSETDPHGSITDSHRGRRGGSYFDYAASARAAYRDRTTPSNRSRTTGFRCARTL